jgi:hypothetical protein
MIPPEPPAFWNAEAVTGAKLTMAWTILPTVNLFRLLGRYEEYRTVPRLRLVNLPRLPLAMSAVLRIKGYLNLS